MRGIKGFTLIELLIVIAIILILIAIALPNFLEAQIRAKVAKAAGEIRSLSTAQESYNIDWRSYTHDCGGNDEIQATGGANFPPGCVALTSPIAYIGEFPQDPFGTHESTGGNIVTGPTDDEIPFYPMVTGVTLKTESKIVPYLPPFSRQTPPFREAYMIFSAGPSDVEPGNPSRTWPVEASQIPPGSGVAWTIYSPTNGTKSFGGILTVGGSRLDHPLLQHLNGTPHL